MKHLVAPSLLAADFLRLDREVAMINASEADWLHIDVMDGQFVPNISFGFPVLEAIGPLVKIPLDVHLMIGEPWRYIERFRAVGAHIITIHAEVCAHLHSDLAQIRRTGALAGVALNPHTPVPLIEHVLDDVDLILVMSVNPGFGGQKFIYRSLRKIEQVREIAMTRNLNPHIEVDGGIGLHNAEAVLNAGANVLVAGSTVFGDADPKGAIAKLKRIGQHSLLA